MWKKMVEILSNIVAGIVRQMTQLEYTAKIVHPKVGIVNKMGLNSEVRLAV